jgi:hypothetical protein
MNFYFVLIFFHTNCSYSVNTGGRPRNRWQDEVRGGGRIVGGEEWQEKLYNREEWKKLLRTARNRRILRMPME